MKEKNDLNKCKRNQLEKEKSMKSKFIAKFSKDNDINSSAILSYLFHLSIIEEIFIVRINMQTDFWFVRDYQYEYSGHVVDFM